MTVTDNQEKLHRRNDIHVGIWGVKRSEQRQRGVGVGDVRLSRGNCVCKSWTRGEHGTPRNGKTRSLN